MKSYEQIVEWHSRNRIREMLSNGSHSHGAVLFKNIFKIAIEDKLDVKIATGSLLKEFYHSFVEDAVKVLAFNRIDVVLLSPDYGELNGNDFLRTVTSSRNGRVQVADGGNQKNHFILAGKKVYRLETDHDRGMAFANFNDPTVGGWLSKEFEGLMKIAKPWSSLDSGIPARTSNVVAAMN